MTNRSSISPYVNALLNDASILTALVDPALDALDVGKAGWPTSAPGASQDAAGGSGPAPSDELQCSARVHGVWPCICHAAARESSTQTEQAALDADQAQRDEREMIKALKAAQVHARKAALIAQRWATPVLDKATVQKRLATIDAGIWCTNHIAHQMMEPRRPKGTLCEFCQGFHSQYKQLPPFEVLDFKARGGRLDERRTQLLMTLAKERKKADEERAEREEAERAAMKAGV